MPRILTEVVLTRISEEEKAEWTKLAGDVPLPLFIRRVMAHVAGKPEMIERLEKQVALGKVNRAHHMRKFLPAKGATTEANDNEDAAQRAAG